MVCTAWGVSVVNALSTRVDVPDPPRRLQVDAELPARCAHGTAGPRPRVSDTGTEIVFWADDNIFETIHYDFETLSRRFQEMGFPEQGLTINLTDERPREVEVDEDIDPTSVSYCYAGGIADFICATSMRPRARAISRSSSSSGDLDKGISAEVAMQWNQGFGRSVYVRQHDQHHRGVEPMKGELPVLVDVVDEQVHATGASSRTRTPT